MRPIFYLLLAAAMAPGLLAATPARAQDAAVYVVTYLEVAPAAAKDAVGLLKAAAAASRKEDGNLRAQVVEDRGRPSRFALIEAWKDQKALDAHNKSSSTTDVRQKLAAIQVSPADERRHNSFLVAPGMAANARGTIWVLTHVDVPPPSKDGVMGILKTLGEETRKQPGNLMFEAVQQTSRPNHFTVVEAWKGTKDHDAHVTSVSTKQFREKLTPMAGALYDERLYKAVD